MNSSIIVPPPSPKKPAPEKKLPRDSSAPYYIHVNLVEKVLGLLGSSTFTSFPLIFHALPSLSHPPPSRLCCIAESGCGEGGIEEERNSRHLGPRRRGGGERKRKSKLFFAPFSHSHSGGFSFSSLPLFCLVGRGPFLLERSGILELCCTKRGGGRKEGAR